VSLPSFDEPIGGAAPPAAPVRDHSGDGITYPSIDELLERSGSKYQLVLYAAKRARQINAYYSQLGEGLLEYVGPLVETHVQEKPLSVALREINSDLLRYTPGADDLDPTTVRPTLDAAAAGAAFDDLGPEIDRATGTSSDDPFAGLGDFNDPGTSGPAS
jgi:DNA-directed RNA polymerase subunit omega